MTDPQHSDDADAVRADIVQTRAELADTVDALTEKLDVKQHAADKVADAKDKVVETASRAKQSAPEPVQHALDTAAAKTGPAVHRIASTARPHRSKIIAALVVGTVALVVIRRKRADR